MKEQGVSTDIAVIEEYDPSTGEWETLFFIGPDRSEGEFNDFIYDKPRLRIRYFELNNNES